MNLKLVFPTVNHGHIGDLKLVHVHNAMHLGLLYGNGSKSKGFFVNLRCIP
jgi:hypothetical protein